MSQEPTPSSSNGIPGGLVIAAMLLGVAAIIGASAMLIFVLSSTGLLGPSQPPVTTANATAVPGAAAAPTALGASTELVASGPTAVVAPPGGGTAYPGGTPAAQAAAPATVPAMAGNGREMVVEDWSGYRDDDALRKAFKTNVAWVDNTLKLSELSGKDSPHGPAGAALDFDIKAAAPSDYVGFERDLATAEDWRPYDQLAVWAQSTDHSARQLVLQWHERSGEVWRHRVKLSDLPASGPLVVPLTQAAWEWADWSTKVNQKLDLDEVTHVAVFVGHDGPGAGTVRLGTIAVQNSRATSQP